MKINEAIKSVMKSKGITQSKLAVLTGETGQSMIGKKLVRSNLTVDTINRMLNVLDYELVIQPKKRGKRPEGQILIESEVKE